MSGWSTVTWDTARAGGLISYVLLTAAVSLGLVLRNRWQSSRWPRLVTNELHGYVSLPVPRPWSVAAPYTANASTWICRQVRWPMRRRRRVLIHTVSSRYSATMPRLIQIGR